MRITFAVALAALAGCGRAEILTAQPAQAAPASKAVEQGPGKFDAKATFQQMCTSCHEVGEPGVDVALQSACCSITVLPVTEYDDPDTLVRPVNFSDPAYWAYPEPTDAYLTAVITNGGAAMGLNELMPAWGKKFDQAQIAALVEHVKSLRPAAAR